MTAVADSETNCRLYCLVPNLDAARAVRRTLGQADGAARTLRVVARRETLVPDLPLAGLRERSAIVEAARRGLIMGSIGGLISGLVAAYELPVSFLIRCALVPFGILAGSAFGAFASAMMGIEEPHSTIRPYQEAIEAGQVLILLDVSDAQTRQIKDMIRQNHADTIVDIKRDMR
ncbi:MAG TPA: hypothetical protein VK110_03985 [Salinisphaeraceae bacterium]|nr:hypothetical protein [Salinisphaeraceae bacterium]